MDEHFKEIEGLLEDAEPVEPRSCKKYAKLIIPHVALVAVVCLYAVIGAWIFYSLESPHEDRLKRNGVVRINDLRRELVSSMWEKGRRGMTGLSMEQWMSSTDRRLQQFNENLYRAFKEEYVRYPDVRIAKSRTEPRESDGGIARFKRHRKAKTRSEKGEKLWTASSALFFAATTMATIGYGNIVPVTPYGRIACVVFALFGAPLAIITIGDLGKFLSECTIWLYKKMKKGRNLLSYRFRKWRLRKSGVVTEIEEDVPSESDPSTLDWDDLAMDKTEVPVLLVFAILLLYIAFGGVLFAVLESWTYMDAFYYCFVSLTTIGFGDLVPERHEYIVLMLIYLGVGLAVTTMCIDLVGIQYIQKIHYFGRKFRGTDLLHLLKRKRMIERRLAMGHGEEILHMYLQHLQEERPEAPAPVTRQQWNRKEFAVPCDTNDNVPQWQVDETVVDDAYPFEICRVERLPTPTMISVHSVKQTRTPSLYSNSTASMRSMMYYRQQFRRTSCSESGPTPEMSVHCSLSTEPSVAEREAMFNNYRTPVSSLLSFEYQFQIPSPDLELIAKCAKSSRRVRSCPSTIDVPSPNSPPISPHSPPISPHSPPISPQSPPISPQSPPVSPNSPPISPHSPPISPQSPPVSPPISPHLPLVSLRNSPIGLACMEEWDSYIKMLDEYCKPYMRVDPPPAEVEVEVPRTPSPPQLPEVTFVIPSPQPDLEIEEDFREEADDPARYWSSLLGVETESITETLDQSRDVPSEDESQETGDDLLCETLPVPSVHAVCVTHEDSASTSSSESSINALPGQLDGPSLSFQTAFNTKSEQLGANANEDPAAELHSGVGDSQVPVFARNCDPCDARSALRKALTCPDHYIGKVPPTLVTKNYCFVIDGDLVSMAAINAGSEQWWKATGTAIRYYYSDDLNKLHQVNALVSRGEVRCAYRVRAKGAGMEQVSTDQIFKLTRHFSYWESCAGFHRIVSVVSPITRYGQMCAGFRRRIFVQYLWRTNEPRERRRVEQEYAKVRRLSLPKAGRGDVGVPEVMTQSVPNLGTTTSRSSVSLQTASDIAAFIRITVHGKC